MQDIFIQTSNDHRSPFNYLGLVHKFFICSDVSLNTENLIFVYFKMCMVSIISRFWVIRAISQPLDTGYNRWQPQHEYNVKFSNLPLHLKVLFLKSQYLDLYTTQKLFSSAHNKGPYRTLFWLILDPPPPCVILWHYSLHPLLSIVSRMIWIIKNLRVILEFQSRKNIREKVITNLP